MAFIEPMHRNKPNITYLLTCTIWGDLFITATNLKLRLIFWRFQNGRDFEVTTNFFTVSDTVS